MAETIGYDDFAKLELRIAKVIEARPHPNADKLMLLQVDLGDEQKQIVAGIRQHYTAEQLIGQADRDCQQPCPGHATRRDQQWHAAGGHIR